MGKHSAEGADDDEDELSELLDALDEDGDEEAIGIDDAEALDLAEIGDAPEDVGLDVETLESSDDTLSGLDDDQEGDEGESTLDDETLDIDSDLDDEDDEAGWTEGSEGAGEAFDDDELLGDDDDPDDADDGGLEGVDDPLIDALIDDEERSIRIDGGDDDAEEDEALDRLELDIG